MKQITSLLTVICFLFACKKEATEIIPREPSIELLSVGPSTVIEFEQPVLLRFSYEDGDGDLGQSDPDEHSLWVKDSRLNTPDGYHIIPLAPPDTELAIKGELEVQLSPLFLLGNGTEEQMTYSFYIVDRAGNRSNEIATPAITILPQDSV